MKIAVLHATAGAGHKKAAEAITNGFKSRGQHQVTCIDALDYTNPFFKAMYPTSYVFMVTKMPAVWAFAFWLLDLPLLWPLLRLTRRIYNGLNTQPLEAFLLKEQFDVIYCTHFLSAEVLGCMKRKGKLKAKVICCVTDFDVHRIWVNKGIDLYTVACEFTANRLRSLGIPDDQIKVTGIPVDEKFGGAVDQVAMRNQLGLAQNQLTILMATGSFGIGPMADLIDALQGFQLLVVCGHNKNLYDQLKPRHQGLVHIYGLVNNMDELMKASDIMVTKPGGLSVAEALTVKLPMIFFSAIPGQETGNINVLKAHGAGEDEMKPDAIARKIKAVANDQQQLAQWRNNLVKLSRPNAVSDIVQLV